jgi:hypothetical protein
MGRSEAFHPFMNELEIAELALIYGFLSSIINLFSNWRKHEDSQIETFIG